MAQPMPMSQNAPGSNLFKEAVCIDAGRIYDSCSDKDCLEDLECYFTDAVQPIIDQAVNVKCKRVEIINVYIDLEPVPFNKGFFSVDMTFFFLVKLNVYTSPLAQPVSVEGICVFSKKVILFGSEGNVKVFSSNSQGGTETNQPKASVQAVDPICLGARIVECRAHSHRPCPCDLPSVVCGRFDGVFQQEPLPQKVVLITLGLFTIVQIERTVQMLVPCYDFCVPDKQCVSSTDDPCEIFRRIKFPINEFFPPRLSDVDPDGDFEGGCGCSQ